MVYTHLELDWKERREVQDDSFLQQPERFFGKLFLSKILKIIFSSLDEDLLLLECLR
jgi:hypothetical protein